MNYINYLITAHLDCPSCGSPCLVIQRSQESSAVELSLIERIPTIEESESPGD